MALIVLESKTFFGISRKVFSKSRRTWSSCQRAAFSRAFTGLERNMYEPCDGQEDSGLERRPSLAFLYFTVKGRLGCRKAWLPESRERPQKFSFREKKSLYTTRR